MKRIIIILLTASFLISCSDSSSNGTGLVTVNLTDAPVSTTNLTSVNINVTEISAQISGIDEGGWQVLKSFNPGLDINLLDYSGGLALALAEDVELPAGSVNQIRFMLNAPEEGEDGSNPGCYLEYDEGDAGIITYPLFIPSGSSSGFKAVGSFDIPVNGSVTVTADFDARKSLVDSDGTYKLKPVIRLIIDNEAGKIKGTVTMDGHLDYSKSDYTAYAYEADSYTISEQTPDSDGIVMTGAVNSAALKDDGSYVLPYLSEGTYDVLVAEYRPGDGFGNIEVAEDVSVTAGNVTTQNIDIITVTP